MAERVPPPLARTSCWLLTDTDEVMGELSLTGALLRFEPEPGAEEHGLRLPMARILGATVTPIKERLMVQTLSHTRWFSGPGVPTLGRRLEALLHPSPPPETPLLGADEPLLVSGPAWWGPLRGELWLTDRRVRFVLQEPWAWLARQVGRADWLEVPRDRARPLLAEGALLLEDLGVRLVGSTAHQAAAHLSTQCTLHLTWPTRWRQRGGGGGGQRGVVTLDEEHLRLLSLRTGAAARAIPLESIHRLSLRWGALQLSLIGEAHPIRISLPTPRLLLQRILHTALQARGLRPSEESGPERARLVQRTVRWHSDGAAELGRLELVGRLMRFVPNTPDTDPIEIRLSELRRAPGPAHTIRIEHAGQVLRFEPSGGGDAVEQFWRTHDIPERIQPWPREATDQRRLLSDPRCVTISTTDGQEIVLRPGMLVEHTEGFGVVMPDTAALPPVGTQLSIEIGRADGIYQMDVRLLGAAPLPALRFPRAGQVFVFAAPEEVRFFNQRAAFRVAMQMPVSAWKLRLDSRRNTWIPDGDRITGQLIDLSISGCALHTRATIQPQDHLFLEMLIDDHWLPLEVECVRVEPGWPEGNNLGLRFLNLPERLEQLLSRTVLARQRTHESSG